MKYKKKVTIYIASMIVLVALLFWFTKMERERIAIIESTGIETIGTVIDKGITRNSYQAANYSLHFEFEHNGKKIVSYQHLYENRRYYDNAIIGMKYKVKYLPNVPQKNAIIYINKPIETEYDNIEKEKERIFNTYK